MTTLNKHLHIKLFLLLIFTITFFTVTYFAYFYNNKHQKDINKLRIIDFYDLRVDISVDILESRYGVPYKVISDYDYIKESLWDTVLYSEYRDIDEKTCAKIFKGKDRMDTFYSYDFKPINVVEYIYKYYDEKDIENSFVIYVESNKIVGVSCE